MSMSASQYDEIKGTENGKKPTDLPPPNCSDRGHTSGNSQPDSAVVGRGISLVDGAFYWVNTALTRSIVLEAESGALRGSRRSYTAHQLQQLGDEIEIVGPIACPFDDLVSMDGSDMLAYREETSDDQQANTSCSALQRVWHSD